MELQGVAWRGAKGVRECTAMSRWPIAGSLEMVSVALLFIAADAQAFRPALDVISRRRRVHRHHWQVFESTDPGGEGNRIRGDLIVLDVYGLANGKSFLRLLTRISCNSIPIM